LPEVDATTGQTEGLPTRTHGALSAASGHREVEQPAESYLKTDQERYDDGPPRGPKAIGLRRACDPLGGAGHAHRAAERQVKRACSSRARRSRSLPSQRLARWARSSQWYREASGHVRRPRGLVFDRYSEEARVGCCTTKSRALRVVSGQAPRGKPTN